MKIFSKIIKKNKEKFLRTISTIRSNFFVPWLLDLIRDNTDENERIHLYLNEIKYVTDKITQMKIFLQQMEELVEPEERFLLPSFEKGYGPETERVSYQQMYVNFNIKEGDKVLDIGSGAYPFPYATHLADLYEEETTHRAEPIIKDKRPFKVCNIEALPYRDKEFDFVYCSHVLEHTTHPEKACEEIMRVGKRGYIETPTRMSDIMLNFTRLKDHHKWYVNLLGDTLFFFEWPEKEKRDTGFNEFFKMLHSKYKNPFQELYHKNRDLFVNILLWENKFHYFVFNKNGQLMATNSKFI